jgi:hypothetical protein
MSHRPIVLLAYHAWVEVEAETDLLILESVCGHDLEYRGLVVSHPDGPERLLVRADLSTVRLPWGG